MRCWPRAHTAAVGAFYTRPELFISILSSNDAAIQQGTTFLRVVALGIPFAALNLVGSRTLVGADDAHTAV